MKMAISICVATYKRPSGLLRLLQGLNQLEFCGSEAPEIAVIVADNDETGSARPVCEDMSDRFRWSLVYGIEPRQGVTFARNHAVAMAPKAADFFVFIDDDEVPKVNWLDQLLLAQSTYAADVVTGPVFPRFEAENVAPWVIKGGFFCPREHETGKLMRVAFTNNVMVRGDWLRQLEPPFDNSLAFRGAEDVHLFSALFQRGARIVWSNEAVVYEFIPESRTRLEWILARGYYGWSAHSLAEKTHYPSLEVQGARFVKGCLLIALGVVTLIPSAFLGKHRLAKSLLHISRGLGSLSGLVNVQGAWGGAAR